MICIKESARGLPHQVRLSQTPMGTASEKSPKISKMIDEAFTLIALALATLLLGTLINLAASWLSPAAAPVEPLRTRREPASRTRPAAVAGTVAPAPRASATAAGWACAVRFDGPDQEHVVNGRTFSSGAAAATAVTAAVEAGAGAHGAPLPPPAHAMRAPPGEEAAIQCFGHTLRLQPGGGGVQYSIDSAPPVQSRSRSATLDVACAAGLALNSAARRPDHITLSPSAVCLGDRCVPWKRASKAKAAAAPPAPERVQAAGQAAPAPAGPQPTFLEQHSATLVYSGGATVPCNAVRGKVLALYFSAHWCPPCRKFTPALVEWFSRVMAAPVDTPLSLVFVSRDRNAAQFADYLKQMRGALAVPFANGQARDELADIFGVASIPSLLLVDHRGVVIRDDGRTLVQRDPDGAGFPWTRRPLHELRGVPVTPRAQPAPAIAVGPRELETSQVAVAVPSPLPRMMPLSSPEELERWRPGSNPAAVARPGRRHRAAPLGGDQPRLLVCHDMMGGYTEQVNPHHSPRARQG